LDGGMLMHGHLMFCV